MISFLFFDLYINYVFYKQMDNNTAFDSTLKELSERVSQFTNNNDFEDTRSKEPGFLSSINMKSPYFYYIVIPITISCILLWFKPKFVKEEVEPGSDELRMSYKKVFIGALIGSALIAITMFAYSYKKRT